MTVFSYRTFHSSACAKTTVHLSWMGAQMSHLPEPRPTSHPTLANSLGTIAKTRFEMNATGQGLYPYLFVTVYLNTVCPN